jgi:hypothetical protein
MVTSGIEQIEITPFEMSSRWRLNRSKYMTLLAVKDNGFQQGKYVADLLFLCFYLPIPAQTLQSHLPNWVQWRYLSQTDNNCYIIEPAGFRLLRYLYKKIPFACQEWNADIAAWRSVDKSCCKTPDGAWLPPAQLMRVLESMKYHRHGTPRPTAGRKLWYNRCPVCGCGYRKDILECPACAARTRLQTSQQKLTQPAHLTLPSVTGPVCSRCGKGIMVQAGKYLLQCAECGHQEWGRL